MCQKNVMINSKMGFLLRVIAGMAVCLSIGCNESASFDQLRKQTVAANDQNHKNVNTNPTPSPVNTPSQSGVGTNTEDTPSTPAQEAQSPSESEQAPGIGDPEQPQEQSGEQLPPQENPQNPGDGDGSAQHGQVIPPVDDPPAMDPPVDDPQENPGDPENPETTGHTWAQPVEAPGLPNLFRVSDDVYRSAQPESGGFASAEELGIKTILSIRLTANDAVLAESEPTNLTLIHLPLAPIYITVEDMAEVMQAFDTAEKPILVHCLHGADRTGLTIALYRILYEGWSKEEAKDELANGGFGYHTAFDNILEFIDALDVEDFKARIGLDQP